MSESAAASAITIKKYANRRLYNMATSSYVTLSDLSEMVKQGREFNVYDARSGEDITRSILIQIIAEEESGNGQQNLLPVSFLRQLIGFYGDSMQWLVPKYLEQSMQTLSNNQDQLRDYLKSTFGNMFPFSSTLEEMGKQNLAMFGRVMEIFAPFAGQQQEGCGGVGSGGGAGSECGGAADGKKSKRASSGASCSPAPKNECGEGIVKGGECASSQSSSSSSSQSSSSQSSALQSALASSEVHPTGGKPSSPFSSPDMPMPNVRSAVASSASSSTPSADDMQQKIANLQRQLAELARNRA